MKTPTAFTLIELLVVVSIIAVLMAMLMPAMESAVAAAQQAKCAAQHRAGALVTRMYASDNRDYIIPQTNIGPGGETLPDSSFWWYFKWYQKYGAVREAYFCPNDVGWPGSTISPDRPLYSNYPTEDAGDSGVWPVSYYLSNHSQKPSLHGIKLTTLSIPAKTVLMCEWPGMVGFSWHRSRGNGTLTPYAIHNDALNIYGFLDGHADATETYWNGGWAFDYNPPDNYDYLWLPQ